MTFKVARQSVGADCGSRKLVLVRSELHLALVRGNPNLLMGVRNWSDRRYLRCVRMPTAQVKREMDCC